MKNNELLLRKYRQTSNISHSLVGNKLVDHSDVVGASPVGAALIPCQCCSNYIFILNLIPGFNGLGRDNCKTRWQTFKCWDHVPYTRDLTAFELSCHEMCKIMTRLDHENHNHSKENFQLYLINPLWNGSLMSSMGESIQIVLTNHTLTGILSSTLQLLQQHLICIIKSVLAIEIDVEFGTHQHPEPSIGTVTTLHHQRNNGLVKLESIFSLWKKNKQFSMINLQLGPALLMLKGF